MQLFIDHESFLRSSPIVRTEANLPHWRQEHAIYFVTFRLADSLPQVVLKAIQAELLDWRLARQGRGETVDVREESDQRFRSLIKWMDRGHGACVLARAELRSIVESTLLHGDGRYYELGAFVVASNHVHALVRPMGDSKLSRVLHAWKSSTSHRICRATGMAAPLWQKESYDHIVRSEASYRRIEGYIQRHKGARSDGE